MKAIEIEVSKEKLSEVITSQIIISNADVENQDFVLVKAFDEETNTTDARMFKVVNVLIDEGLQEKYKVLKLKEVN